MFSNRKRRLLVVLMVVVTLLVSGMTTLAASSEVTLSGFNVPSSVVVGHGITVKGTVSSNVTIKRIEVGVVNASTNSWTQSRYDNPNVNATTFDLSKAAGKMAVSRLGKGTYKYRIYAHTSDGKVHIVLNKQFTITAAPPKNTASSSAQASNTSKPAAQTTASKVTVSGFNVPASVTAGHGITVKGTVSSNVTIKRIEVGVVNASNNSWTSSRYDNQSVNAKTFDLSKAAGKMAVSRLGKGTYKYRIYAHTSDGKVHIVLNKQFTITAAPPKKTASSAAQASNTSKPAAQTTASKVTVSGFNVPESVVVGHGIIVKGTVSSNVTIKRIEVGVVDASYNSWTSSRYDNQSVNAKTFDLSKAAGKMAVSKLGIGTYKYRIYVHTTDGKVHTVLNKEFSVNANASGTTAKTTTLAPTNTTASTAKNTVTIKGLTRPGTYRVGTSLHTKGIITSKEKIKRIEAGIIFAPTNKWTPYYYDNKLVNSNTFDLTRVDSKLSFSKLPAGEYRYRIYVHTASGMTVALNHKFNVIGSNKPQLAVNWAIRIANDNSFTYGRKPEANAVGCYFCGTNCGPVKYRKPKGYEKTYVCLTFIGAAYAHGAKDPEILSECKRGRMTMYETDDNFRLFSCWMKLGSCKDLKISDLMPGDVIIQWSDWNDNNGHVCMYIGNDKLVESSGGGWDANSIAVKSGAGRRLRSLGYGKNYVMRYTK